MRRCWQLQVLYCNASIAKAPGWRTIAFEAIVRAAGKENSLAGQFWCILLLPWLSQRGGTFGSSFLQNFFFERMAITGFALFLALISLGLLVWHWQTWSRAKISLLDQSELLYAGRQFRRRALASILSVILAGLLWYSPRITDPIVAISFWCAILLLVVGICLVAVSDMANTRVYFRRVQQQQIAEQAALRAELHRLQRQQQHGSNGTNGRQHVNGRTPKPEQPAEEQSTEDDLPIFPSKGVDADEEGEG